MATFPALTPSEAPITPGAWPSTAHKSLNGAESSIRHGSAEIGRRWRPLFPNITEANFQAILSHYRGQRSGFDSFGFSTTTLAADLTPAGFAWLYASPPEVVDEHVDCFTVQCEFRCEPRGLVVASGRAWRTGATVFTPGSRDGGVVYAAGASWVTPATTFEAGFRSSGVGSNGVKWVSASSTFTPGARSGGSVFAAGKNWVTPATTFTPGNKGGSGKAAIAFTGGTSITWGSNYSAYGWSFRLSLTKTIKGVGFYDQGQNGLNDQYEILLEDDSINDSGDFSGSTPVSFDASGNVLSMTVPSGTAATLDGSWRRLDLTTPGRALPPGTYFIAAAPSNYLGLDNVIRSATGVTTDWGVFFGRSYRYVGNTPSTVSSFGTAFFGPMIFFEESESSGAATNGVDWATTATTFAPGSAEVTDPDFQSVSLLLHMDGTNGSTTFIDSSPVFRTVTTYGDALISTAQSKFGGADGLSSGYFDGSGDCLSVNIFQFGYSGNFTVELWVYQLSQNSKRAFVDITDFILYCDANESTLRVYHGGVVLSGGTVPLNQWTHIAVTRQGSIGRMFVNGVKVSENTSYTAPLSSANTVATIYIGAENGSANFYNGYVDELRLTQSARYTANFTPPSAPFPDA